MVGVVGVAQFGQNGPNYQRISNVIGELCYLCCDTSDRITSLIVEGTPNATAASDMATYDAVYSPNLKVIRVKRNLEKWCHKDEIRSKQNEVVHIGTC